MTENVKDGYIKFIFLGIVIVLIGVSFITYKSLVNYMEEVELVRHSNRVLRELDGVLSTIRDAETGHRGYQLSRDTSFLRPYYEATSVIEAKMHKLDSLLAGQSGQLQSLDTLRSLVTNQFNIIHDILAHEEKARRYMDEYEMGLLKEGKRNTDHIRMLINRMIKVERSSLEARLSDEESIESIAPITLLFYALFALSGATFLFIRIIDALEKRKRAEENLRKNIIALHNEGAIREFTQKTLRSVLDSSFSGIMAFKSIRDRQGKVVDFEWILSNSKAAAAIGKTEKELVGKKLLEVLPGQRSHGLFDLYHQVVETGKPMQVELHYQADGLDVWFSIAAVKLSDGFVSTLSDITDRKIQELRLQEREFLLKEAEAIAVIGSWRWDADSDKMIWSDGLCQIFDKQHEGFSPTWHSFIELALQDDKAPLIDVLQKAREQKEGFKTGFRAIVNGQMKYLTITGRIRKNMRDRYAGFLGTVKDVTEEEVYMHMLQQQANELRRSNEDLEQFAYVASHDLQEPLRKIRAFGDRLEAKFKDHLDSAAKDYIGRMRSAAERMQMLIQDILAFSRVSRSKGESKVIDLNVLLQEVLEILETSIETEKAVICVARLPVIEGDPSQISRLFQNIIANAIKFRRPQRPPKVDISVSKVSQEAAEAEVLSPLQYPFYYRIVVKDNGIGFDEKYAEKIFNIFQRLHGRFEYEGTGIGLAICRKIVTNHNGYIVASSTEGEGSEFVIFLPVERHIQDS